MMGGLIDGATVKSDLFLVEAGKLPMKCYQVETSAIAPGSRVGHASLLVGNAFIVFGGDTKLEETDVLDDTLYLLNTCKLSFVRIISPIAHAYKHQDTGRKWRQRVRDRPVGMVTR